ncbi:MAG: UvrD-helicase domain-containing protein [Eubacterium sp.]|nr:UvrD-helicase domain-containing protein [Candidatus Colimonas fimequi]
MAWTDKQQRTIELRGKNILVSAAAGSGKTAVLIERIKQLILDPENPVDVDRFLITTFTKAAAAEMKGRLEKAIRKAMSEEGANKEHLRRQLRLLPRANISTFHSFTIEILKKYFYLIDLEPGFKTADENQMVIFKRESIDELFDKRFSEDYDAFTAWLNKYSTYKSEEAIKGSILAVYNEMRSIPHYMKWAEDTAANYHSDSPIKAFAIDKFIEEEVEKDLNEAYRLYQKAADTLREEDLVRMADIIEGNLEQLKKIPRYYEESGVFPRVPDLNLTSVSAKKDEKDTYAMVKDTVQQYQNEAKKIINSISENYFAIPWDEYDKDMRAQAADIDYLIGLIKEFEEIFNAKKATVMAVEFDDMMHYAIDILEDETVQKEYREKYEYIFVDEYQDSNQLQETIVGLIARDNNLFMVGDVKQSIYKFRQAEPKLFMDRYAKNASDDEVLSENIDLNTNFRSKPEVIDTVNAIFGEVMKGYDDNAALHYPATFEKYEGGTTALRVVNNASYSDSDELGEAEFKAIADEIKAHLGTDVYDVPAQKTRKVSYRDIPVLTRGNPMMASLERYLNNEGIPAFGNSSDGYFETVELQVFLNMLRVINNTRQDIPLISVMRSVAFGFTARQMAQIRIQYKEGSF